MSDATTASYTATVYDNAAYYAVAFSTYTADSTLRSADLTTVKADASVVEGATTNTLVGV